MDNIENYRKRFFDLMESTIGDVKPLINELKQGQKECDEKNSDVCYECVKGNCENGRGRMNSTSNGVLITYYDGEWVNSKYEGKGTYVWVSSGFKYVGEFKNNERDGYGTETNPCCGTFVGYQKNSQWNGYGTYTEKNGTVQKGIWSNGKLTIPDYNGLLDPNRKDNPSTPNTPSNDCDSLKLEADKQTVYNTNNLSSGKLVIGLKNQGPLVKYVQCLLNGKNKELSLGLPDLTVDGIFGNQTKIMVTKFQGKNGLPADGVVGKKTFSRLF
jgi:peptidoglycan hydrolase-like protein with peptidoglycan-binding domain